MDWGSINILVIKDASEWMWVDIWMRHHQNICRSQQDFRIFDINKVPLDLDFTGATHRFNFSRRNSLVL